MTSLQCDVTRCVFAYRVMLNISTRNSTNVNVVAFCNAINKVLDKFRVMGTLKYYLYVTFMHYFLMNLKPSLAIDKFVLQNFE